MATTPNYSWPTPDDTDLVKDGAEAIRDLGNAIDSTVFANSPGLVHINETTFSGTAAVNVNNVFSATYSRYLIYLDAISSSNTNVFMRVRASGTDNTATNYRNQSFIASSTTLTGARSTGATSWRVGDLQTSGTGTVFNEIVVQNPFQSQKTQVFSRGNYAIDGNLQFGIFNGALDVTTSYDGFTLFFESTFNATGTLNVYGYKLG